MGSHLTFNIYATNTKTNHIAHFNTIHTITNPATWTTTLVLMTLVQIVCKLGIQLLHGHALIQHIPTPTIT